MKKRQKTVQNFIDMLQLDGIQECLLSVLGNKKCILTDLTLINDLCSFIEQRDIDVDKLYNVCSDDHKEVKSELSLLLQEESGIDLWLVTISYHNLKFILGWNDEGDGKKITTLQTGAKEAILEYIVNNNLSKYEFFTKISKIADKYKDYVGLEKFSTNLSNYCKSAAINEKEEIPEGEYDSEEDSDNSLDEEMILLQNNNSNNEEQYDIIRNMGLNEEQYDIIRNMRLNEEQRDIELAIKLSLQNAQWQDDINYAIALSQQDDHLNQVMLGQNFPLAEDRHHND